MEEIRINDNLLIRKEKKYNVQDMSETTIITLIEYGEEIVMVRAKTDENFIADVVYDGNYIIAYTKGTNASSTPAKISCVYDTINERFMYLNNKLRERLVDIYLSYRPISLKTILAVINGYTVPESKRAEVMNALDYLRNEDNTISRKEVADYIFSIYPELEKFSHFKNAVSIYEYDEIVDEIGENFYFFHAMPHLIDDGGPKKKDSSNQKRIGTYPLPPTKNGLKEF